MRKIIYVLIPFFFFTALPAYAVGPMDELKGPIDRVIDILKDPQYNDESKKDSQHDKMWGIIKSVFDFDKISQLALAKYRKKFNKEQMETFTEEFTELLGNTYIKKIQGEFKNEKVKYLKEKIDKKGRATVKTVIVRESVEVPIDYKMWKKSEKWRIFDVKVEGVSLVKNYRTQFSKILFKETPDQLIERIKNKNQNKGGGIED